ncbi:hypothetical protein J4E85_009065 [Alternaria conjuncta]|uniref:uncharacterized protein n=1 Tax=Alternaria conjuncta TaxID=181017 RepID=UPI00221E9F97|nr:uncharacterized protein J4E85_009065 [Alternaria conjuncta]KAI4920950.1 hypothetical protein J4E85_009065 [Alternaria conjuncta]
MDFPHAQMQATLAATNFSPKSVPSLYPQLAKSQKNLHRKDSFVPKPPKVQENTSDNGCDDQGQRQAYRKSSIKNFGSLFARNRSSIASTSPLTQVMSSESEGRDTSVETERASQQTTLVSSDIPSPSNLMTVAEREKIRERHRKFVKLQGLGHDHPTVFTADPGDYSQYDYDDSVDNRRFRDECGECEGTHVAHDLASPTPSSRHRRNESLHVNLSAEEVKKYADEVRNMTIADVHLSLFGYWIKESDEHFQEAKKYLRELGLDRGYNLSRLNNFCLEELCRDVHDIRPSETRTTILKRQAAADSSAHGGTTTPTRSFSSPVSPRIDKLPPSLHLQREKVIESQALRSTSLGSPGGRGDYPPNTPDRPMPLAFRSPSSPVGFLPSPSHSSVFSSPGPPPVGASDELSLRPSSVTSYDSFYDETTDWNISVAGIYQQVVELEDVGQIDRIISDLQNMKALYSEET